MLLAIDVGNTTVSIGVFRANRLIFSKRFATKKPASLKYYSSAFKRILKNRKIDGVIISSVVPEVTTILKKIIKGRQFPNRRGQFPNRNLRPHRELSPIIKRELSPIVLGEDLTVPIKNLYKNPKQVGQDRLVNAYAGYNKFGGGLIIVDFGTAVTFDVVSKKGEYLGGIIVPGIETSFNALSKEAALLPKIKWGQFSTQRGQFPNRNLRLHRELSPIINRELSPLIGKDTTTSMLTGILNGYGALCDGLVARIKKEVGNRDYKVILTGGHAKLISRFCSFDFIQPNLALEGLYKISLMSDAKKLVKKKLANFS